jgi:hypothetical protein
MASTDARPVPRKNTAFRVYFPIFDADGDLVTGAASLDSEVSIDGAAFADCTNEATEIGSTGLYYLDLTASEMNGDAVVVQVKTGTAGAKTTPLIFYPEEAGDVRSDVVMVSGDAAAADNLEAATDGTGYPIGGVRFLGVSSYGVLDAGAAGGGTLPAGQRDNVAAGQIIWIPGKGDGRLIAAGYNSTTGVFTVDSNFATAAAASDPYIVFVSAAASTTPPMVDVTKIAGSAVDTASAQLGVNVVATAAGAITASSLASDTITAAKIATDAITAAKIATGAIDADAIAADAVTEIQGGLATSSALSTLQADVTTVLARLGAFAGSGLNTVLGFFRALMRKDNALTPSDVGGTYDNTTDSNEAVKDNQLDAAVSTRATPAQVNAEVLDVLGTDTWAELSSLPGEDLTTLRHMIQFLYQRERLKRTATASAEVMYKKDGSTALGTASLADDGTTFTKGSAA